MFAAKVILDSMAPCGKRLITVEATYPRFVHSELLTHRDRARNSASSRAIPFPTMCERILAGPVIPLRWGLEQGGMVQGQELPPVLQELAQTIWLRALTDAMRHARALYNIGATALSLLDLYQRSGVTPGEYDLPLDWYGKLEDLDTLSDLKVHKSLPNRLTEPWMWITVIMTATEWKNFFRLRCHPDAEVHFQKIAGMIRDALEQSSPRQLPEGHWHRPFVANNDEPALIEAGYTEPELNRISVARCARVSYLTHDGKRDPKKDLGLFERLAQGSGFGHWSPAEMVARALSQPIRSGPFIGWHQFRKDFPNENLPG